MSYVWITLASAVYAFGFCWCFDPNGIAFGGITGVGQVIHAALPVIPIGVAVILLNVPLFLLGWRLIGGKLLVSSLFAMAVSSVLLDLLDSWHQFRPMDPLMAAIFGGVLLGGSLGVIFLQGATTGGTDLIARLLKLRLAWLPMGKLMLGADLAVILLVAVVFRNVESALYGLIALYIMSVVMDKVLYGLDNAKVAYIISDRPQELVQAIYDQLDRGATLLKGEGAYTGEDKKVILCAFKQKQIVDLKQVIRRVDPSAFLIVHDAHEVLGDGFKSYHKEEL